MCQDANFDFSTLCGAYFANLEYLSAEWLSENVEKIFSRKFVQNFLSALGGLEYAPATKSSYLLLNGRGLVEHALKFEIPLVVIRGSAWSSVWRWLTFGALRN